MRPVPRAPFVIAMTLALFAMAPRPSIGQTATLACVGNPSHPGQSTASAKLRIGDFVDRVSGAYAYNFPGQLGVQIEIGREDFEFSDENDIFFGGDLFIEAPSSPSTCLSLGARLTPQDEGRSDIWTFPIGMGAGWDVRSSSGLRTLPFIMPQLLILHSGPIGEGDTGVDAGVEGGVTFAGTQVFLTIGGIVRVRSVDRYAVQFGGGVTF